MTDTNPLDEVLVDLAEEPPAWFKEALCAQTDPEAFYPEKGGSARPGKRTCMACPARDRCLEYALERDERFGIWGAATPEERRAIKKRRDMLPQAS